MLLKKWWFWLFVVVMVISYIGNKRPSSTASSTISSTPSPQQTQATTNNAKTNNSKEKDNENSKDLASDSSLDSSKLSIEKILANRDSNKNLTQTFTSNNGYKVSYPKGYEVFKDSSYADFMIIDDKSKSYVDILTVYEIDGAKSLKDFKQKAFENYMSTLLNNKIIIASYINSKINGMDIIYCTYADNLFRRFTVIYENQSRYHILTYKSTGKNANYNFVDMLFTLEKTIK